MKTIALIAIFAVLAAVQSELLSHTPEEKVQWENFKAKYIKTYATEEEAHRFIVFINNLRKIVHHNKQGKSYTLGVNKFADWTHEEYKNFLINSSKKKSKFQAKIAAPEFILAGDVNVDEVDWRKKGAVTPVKDQGQCGSCYSFSATGAAEGQYFIKHGELLSFSEKQIVDCSGDSGNLGCDGGLVEYCYDYLVKYGVMSEEDYSYEPFEDDCSYDESKVVAKVASYYNLPEGDEQALTKQLAKTGPVGVAIDASNWSFQLYESGVYDEPSCGNTQWSLDHAVLAVGYGTTDDSAEQDYYIVKNSWGPDWGSEGYILMKRNDKNQCGIATDAVVPVMV